MAKQKPDAAAAAPEAEKTPAAAPAAKPEYTKAFFSTDSKNTVSLVIDPKNPNFEPGRPAFFGEINDKKVSVFVEPAGEKNGKPYTAFMSINERGAKQADGSYADDVRFGNANMVVTNQGFARLAIKENGSNDTIWAVPRKELTSDQLAAAGLDLAKLETMKASVAAAKAAAPAESKPAPKP